MTLLRIIDRLCPDLPNVFGIRTEAERLMADRDEAERREWLATLRVGSPVVARLSRDWEVRDEGLVVADAGKYWIVEFKAIGGCPRYSFGKVNGRQPGWHYYLERPS